MENDLSEVENGKLSRRGLVKAAAWSAPAVVMMGAAPCVSTSLVEPPKNPFKKDGWLYVDQRDPGSHSSGVNGDFHYLFGKGGTITVPEMEWIVNVIPVPNYDDKIQVDQDRDVWIEEYDTGNLGNAVAFTGTTTVSGSDGKFITDGLHTTNGVGVTAGNKYKAKKNPDGSYTIKFFTPEVTDTRGNQIRSFGFKVFTGRAASWSGRADKLVIQGRPTYPSHVMEDGKLLPVCGRVPEGNEPYQAVGIPGKKNLWVDYDTIKGASPDKRWTPGIGPAENRKRGWDTAQDGRV